VNDTADAAGGSPEQRKPAKRSDGASDRTDKKPSGPIGQVVRFVREVVAELKKVVRPTRAEVITYTSTVLVFVAVVMGFVLVVDLGIGKLTFWVFG
jgi:preprotein translocase subunit SecE